MTESVAEYKVKTAVFEGPLEVLLRLVEEKKLFINEISLAQVTDDYITYVRGLQEKNLSQVTGFLVVAATLLLIKSKSLLPNLELTKEEEGQIGDLEARLRMYQLIKEVGQHIKEKFGKQIIFSTSEKELFEPIFSPDPKITLENMFDSIRGVIEAMPKKEFLPAVSVKKVINIEEVIDSLTSRIQNSLRFSFSEFTKGYDSKDTKEKKVYVIVSFLAMLELVRNGIFEAVQGSHFEDITIEKQVS